MFNYHHDCVQCVRCVQCVQCVQGAQAVLAAQGAAGGRTEDLGSGDKHLHALRGWRSFAQQS